MTKPDIEIFLLIRKYNFDTILELNNSSVRRDLYELTFEFFPDSPSLRERDNIEKSIRLELEKSTFTSIHSNIHKTINNKIL